MEAQQRTRRLDTEEFVSWCESQVDKSQSMTARIIVQDDDMVKFRIREDRERGPEDITLIKGKGTDTIRFEREDNKRQFHLHRRDVDLCDKTLLVKSDGMEVCRAGTGTRNKRGPFPV